jgi:hypothetical protein
VNKNDRNNTRRKRKMDEYVRNLRYEMKYGSKADTVTKHAGCMGCLAGLAGLVAGAYATNETMQWLSADMPTAVRYAADAIGALIAGKISHKIGIVMGCVTGLTSVRNKELENDQDLYRILSRRRR